MATVGDLIKGSMKLLGLTAVGETPSAAELSEGMEVLNQMLDAWSADGLKINSHTRETFSLVASQASYSMGSGGDFNTTRPTYISNVQIVQTASPNFQLPVEIINEDQYEAITVKETESTIPLKMYPNYTFPTATLYFWPVPSEAKSVVISSFKELTEYSSLVTTISVPPGYLKAMRYNLALDLANEYGAEPGVDVRRGAEQSKAILMRNNAARPHYMKVDAAARSRDAVFNWLKGE